VPSSLVKRWHATGYSYQSLLNQQLQNALMPNYAYSVQCSIGNKQLRYQLLDVRVEGISSHGIKQNHRVHYFLKCYRISVINADQFVVVDTIDILLPSCYHTCHHAIIPAIMLSCLPSCYHTCHHAIIPAIMLSCLLLPCLS
jgi:hypothetical protein